MQLASAKIAIAGDVYNVVKKEGLTPAEIMLLKKIHGTEAITDIICDAEVDRTGVAELARLRNTYTARDEAGVYLIDKLFPEAFGSQLPQTFDQIGIDTQIVSQDIPDQEEEAKKVRRRKPEAVVSQVLEAIAE